MSLEILRSLPLFAGLSDNDLQWLEVRAEPCEIKAGALLMEEGTPGDALYVILDGEFEVTKKTGAKDIQIAMRDRGQVIGEMSLLDNAPRSASVRAARDSQLIKISNETFHQLLASSPSAALSMLHIVSSRLKQNEGLLRQSEKMAALGTMAAGLAHELNNPAAAVRRSASELREALFKWQSLAAQLDEATDGHEEHERLHALRDNLARRAAAPVELDPLTRSDRESELQTWLEERGVDDAWEFAPALVRLGWTIPELEQVAAASDHAAFPLLAQWLGVGCSLNSLLDEIRTGAERISEIVKAVKSYSYLDQAPIQEIDIHEGLENTLVILRHKLKNISLTRHYDRSLPRIEAYGSELNQVWTNILDNAIDALKGQGEMLVRTYAKGDRAVVEIADNGPGIPPEIQTRIFEAFFTTKPPGVGTGLGLNIAYNIVNKHNGLIRVESRPGYTCFQVTLPQRLRPSAAV